MNKICIQRCVWLLARLKFDTDCAMTRLKLIVLRNDMQCSMYVCVCGCEFSNWQPAKRWIKSSTKENKYFTEKKNWLNIMDDFANFPIYQRTQRFILAYIYTRRYTDTHTHTYITLNCMSTRYTNVHCSDMEKILN